MAVRVPIAADASAVIRAMSDVAAAIRRAGQEGKAFSQIDLSHPELKEYADTIRKITENTERLTTQARGATAAAARHVLGVGAGANPLNLVPGAGSRYPDRGDANRFIVNAGGYMLQGSPMALPQHQAPGPHGGPAGFGGGQAPATGGGGFFGGALSSLRAGGAFALGLAGVQGLTATVGQGVSRGFDESMANDVLGRTIRSTNTDFDALRLSVRAAANGLQLTYEESQRLSLTWARLANETDPAKLQENVRFATGFARGGGLDPNTVNQSFARASFLGEDPKRFAALIAQAVSNGNMTGQTEQVLQAMLRWTETSSRQLAQAGTSASFAELYAQLNATGIPGLRGAGAENLLGTINNSLTQGGAAGEASQYFSSRMLMRRGIRNPYQQQYIQEGGMFETIPGTNQSILDATMGDLSQMYAGRDRMQGLAGGAAHLGISMRHYEALQNARNAGRLPQMLQSLERSNVRLQDVNGTAMLDIARVNNSSDLNTERANLLKRENLTPEQRQSLEGKTGDSLREAIIQVLAATGRTETEGSRAAAGIARYTNELTEQGSKMVKSLTDLRDGVTTLIDVLGNTADTIADNFNATFRNDPAARARLQTRSEQIATFFGHGPGGAVSDAPAGPLNWGEQARVNAHIESSSRPNATNPASSAYGAHQFTGPTWLDAVRTAAARNPAVAARVAGLDEAGILALRGDADFSSLIMQSHMENTLAPAMTNAGVPVDPLSIRAGVAFGQGAGPRVMRASNDTLLDTILSPAALAANPQYRGMTVGLWKAGAIVGLRRAGVGGMTQGRPGAGNPLPGGTPGGEAGGGAAARTGGQDQGFYFQPLRVIHERPNGEMIGQDMIPVERYGDPQPVGMG